MARFLSDSDPTADARNLKDLLPDGVHVVFSETRHADAALLPAEQEFLNARRMQPVRVQEFRTGRALAREALARLGVDDFALLPAETREPRWPAGIVGSISHCEGICAVAIARSTEFAGLGIDLENIGRIDDTIADTVCTPDERRQLDELPPSSRQQRLSLLFSAKECVFKALFPLTRQFLDFDDVSLTIGDGWFSARPVKPDVQKADLLHGRFFAAPKLILTAAWMPAA